MGPYGSIWPIQDWATEIRNLAGYLVVEVDSAKSRGRDGGAGMFALSPFPVQGARLSLPFSAGNKTKINLPSGTSHRTCLGSQCLWFFLRTKFVSLLFKSAF